MSLLLAGCTANGHTPTGSERKGLATAVSTWATYVTPMSSVSISTFDRAWARVQVANQVPAQDILFHKRGDSWEIAYITDVGQIAKGACAYAPANVMADLYEIKCPSWRALHARRAGKNEATALLNAFFAATPSISVSDRSHYSIVKACVSRLDPSWAVAGVFIAKSGQARFFHEQGVHWRLETRASRAIVLSLASCAGFNAELYGS